ncbi:hypothetical protein DFH06DRAFT_444469 [Mycena polygramma]|nr:hypothetical protein DFH06DRAFT_444469 [Mycena polygramma]
MWAAAREFAMGYVRQREDLGKAIALWRTPPTRMNPPPEWRTPAWRAGWSRDAEGAVAALWVLWFFLGRGWPSECEATGFRRSFSLCPLPTPHPLFHEADTLTYRNARSSRWWSRRFGKHPPSPRRTITPFPVFASAALDAHLGARDGAITVPTNHGAFPIYALGARAHRRRPLVSITHKRQLRLLGLESLSFFDDASSSSTAPPCATSEQGVGAAVAPAVAIEAAASVVPDSLLRALRAHHRVSKLILKLVLKLLLINTSQLYVDRARKSGGMSMAPKSINI